MEAVVRALNRFHAEDESTYLTLMKATIGEAIGINGGSEEIDLLTRRIDALNKRMLELVNETVAAGKDVESSEDEFKSISDQIEQLNRRIAAIQESVRGDATRQRGWRKSRISLPSEPPTKRSTMTASCAR